MDIININSLIDYLNEEISEWESWRGGTAHDEAEIDGAQKALKNAIDWAERMK